MSERKGSSLKSALQSAFSSGAILIALAISFWLFINVMGNPVNFEGGNPKGHPMPGNYLGIVYKGGYIVPILMSCSIILIIFTVERIITLGRVEDDRLAQ